ncbi:MAG: FecR family protein [Thermodesulfobacteriota bacterium]
MLNCLSRIGAVSLPAALLGVFFHFHLHASHASAEAGPKEKNIGWVIGVKGTAAISHTGDNKEEAVRSGTELYPGDRLETGLGSTVTVQFNDDSVLTLAAGTRVEVTDWVYSEANSENRSTFKLLDGHVRGLLNDLFGKDSEMSVRTPTSVVVVRGSDLSVWIEDGETVVAVSEGDGYIRHRGGKFPGIARIKAGYMARVRSGAPIEEPVLIPPDVKKRVTKLRVKRNERLVKKFLEKREQKLYREREKIRAALKNRAREGKSPWKN